MSSANRKTARQYLAGLLVTALEGVGKPAQKVYRYRVADFAGQSPVVVVASGKATRQELGIGGCAWKDTLTMQVFIFAAYAEAGNVNYTEETAQDAVDDIEATVADVVRANRTVNGVWVQATLAEPSTPDSVEIRGVEYLRETMTVDIEVM